MSMLTNSSSKRESKLDTTGDSFYRRIIQLNVVGACLIPPLLVALLPLLLSISLLSPHIVPNAIMAISFWLFGRYQVQKLSRSKRSYDLAMENNKWTIPGIAIALSTTLCRILQPILDSVAGFLILQNPSSYFLLCFKLSGILAIVGVMVASRFVVFGFMRASLYPLQIVSIKKPAEKFFGRLIHDAKELIRLRSQPSRPTPIASISYRLSRPILLDAVPLYVMTTTVSTMMISVTARLPVELVATVLVPVSLVDILYRIVWHEVDPSRSWSSLLYKSLVPKVGWSLGTMVLLMMTATAVPGFLLLFVCFTLTCYIILLDNIIGMALFSPNYANVAGNLVVGDLQILQYLLRSSISAHQICDSNVMGGVGRSKDATEFSLMKAAGEQEAVCILRNGPERALEDDVMWWGVLSLIIGSLETFNLSRTNPVPKKWTSLDDINRTGDCPLPLIRGLCVLLWGFGLATKAWAEWKQLEEFELHPTSVSLIVYDRVIRILQQTFEGECSNDVLSLGPSVINALYLLQLGASEMCKDDRSSRWQEIGMKCNIAGKSINNRICRNSETPIGCLDAQCLDWLQKLRSM